MAEKRLQRDTDNKVIAGVCSGLGNYFNVDPVLARVIFAIAFFAFGAGPLLYLVLWLVMPAKS